MENILFEHIRWHVLQHNHAILFHSVVSKQQFVVAQSTGFFGNVTFEWGAYKKNGKCSFKSWTGKSMQLKQIGMSFPNHLYHFKTPPAVKQAIWWLFLLHLQHKRWSILTENALNLGKLWLVIHWISEFDIKHQCNTFSLFAHLLIQQQRLVKCFSFFRCVHILHLIIDRNSLKHLKFS